jgi:hypothetical protein
MSRQFSNYVHVTGHCQDGRKYGSPGSLCRCGLMDQVSAATVVAGPDAGLVPAAPDRPGQPRLIGWLVFVISLANRRRISLSINGISVWSACADGVRGRR